MDGQPDLQGVWANNNGTPVERPKQYAGETRLTDGEVADLKARVRRCSTAATRSFSTTW